MESNVIEVQMLSELADNVVMRNSPLRGKKMRFDIRKGTGSATSARPSPSWKAASASILPRRHGQHKSEGEIIQRGTSRIDVSGGSVDYLSGHVNTTKLTANGVMYDVGTASPDRVYTASSNLPNSRRNYELGYTVGKDAGSVKLSAPAMVLQGELQGATTIGQHQREVGSRAVRSAPG